MSKKPLKENKWYISAICLGAFATICFNLTFILWDIGQIGQVFMAFFILAIAAAFITFCLGYTENHQEEIKKREIEKSIKATPETNGHFNVWGDENWEQKSEEEKDWEDIEFFEMMEDD